MMAAVLDTDDLKSKAGRLLYRELPEEHRYRDVRVQGELGDLEAFLHGFGHLLDLIRGTSEQAYADAFAEPADNGREAQTWLLPYLAELVGAELLAPDPKRRAEELNNSVSWFKTKGTLLNVDAVADVVSGMETVAAEGWRLVLTTPSASLPPFTALAAMAGTGDPLGPPARPLGTPDLSLANRAVLDPDGTSPLFRLTTPVRDADGRPDAPNVVYWRPRARRGVPCFPNGYDDVSARTPDLRDPQSWSLGPHPNRTLIYVRPPYGLFEPGLKRVTLAGAANPANPLNFKLNESATQVYGPAEVLAALGQPLDPAPDKIEVDGNLTIPAGLRVSFEDILFRGTLTVAAGAHLTLRRCAARQRGVRRAGRRARAGRQGLPFRIGHRSTRLRATGVLHRPRQHPGREGRAPAPSRVRLSVRRSADLHRMRQRRKLCALLPHRGHLDVGGMLLREEPEQHDRPAYLRAALFRGPGRLRVADGCFRRAGLRRSRPADAAFDPARRRERRRDGRRQSSLSLRAGARAEFEAARLPTIRPGDRGPLRPDARARPGGTSTLIPRE